VTEAVAVNVLIPMTMAVKLLMLSPSRCASQISLIVLQFIPPTAFGKQEAPKPSARHAVTNVATKPPMARQSAAITVHVNQKISREAADIGIFKMRAKRSLNGRHVMKWQCSSTRQKSLWLSWGC
jgi:hypothetical protein